MDREYKTVLKTTVCEIEEKKSRFIASVRPVSTEEEAQEFISKVKSKHQDASHNVYCYFINQNTIIQRFSDDGEPTGTAALPILEVIKKTGVRDLVVVVTRYFGGTLLGASGLIRAYGKSASLGIDTACVITKKLCLEVNIVIEYDLFGKVQNMLISKNYIIKDVIYGQDVEIIVFIQHTELQSFIELVNEITNARALVESGKDSYITLNSQGKILLKEEN
ncbi:UNVERIFIED_CONTAM: putative YigZ family protein [Acetivibrio alkalicellulosi]